MGARVTLATTARMHWHAAAAQCIASGRHVTQLLRGAHGSHHPTLLAALGAGFTYLLALGFQQ